MELTAANSVFTGRPLYVFVVTKNETKSYEGYEQNSGNRTSNIT